MVCISIITVVYNDRVGFLKTAASVLEQRKFYPDIEYVVIDGGSTDGTLDSIIELSAGLDYWVSEPDGGIYDAMNKGIKASTGSALLFLNAGDYFVGDVLSGFSTAPSFLPVKYVDIFGRFKDRPVVSVRTGIPNCHQGIIFESKSIYYDCAYDICADYQYFIDHNYSSNIDFVRSSGYVYFDAVGVSATRVVERDKQIFQIRRKRFGIFVAVIHEAYPMLRRFIRVLLKK